jgi:tetratricopeptide (TPR) repeat protein
MNAGGVAMDALNANQPQEALAVLQQNQEARADATSDRPSKLPQGHWNKMALADHALARFQAELAVATAGRSRLGNHNQSWLYDRQVRALAALGDTSRLRQKVDSFVAIWNPAIHGGSRPAYRAATDPAQLYSVAARELSAHGWRREATAYVRKGLAWHEGRAANDDEKSDVFQTSLGELLMLAEKFDAARAIWAKLAVHDTSYTGARILLAIAAARQGDSAAALQTMRVVDSLAKAPYAFGRPFVQEARIAAALGRNDDAARYLQLALDNGAPFSDEWHCAPEFQGLREFAPFKALLAPKG